MPMGSGSGAARRACSAGVSRSIATPVRGRVNIRTGGARSRPIGNPGRLFPASRWRRCCLTFRPARPAARPSAGSAALSGPPAWHVLQQGSAPASPGLGLGPSDLPQVFGSLPSPITAQPSFAHHNAALHSPSKHCLPSPSRCSLPLCLSSPVTTLPSFPPSRHCLHPPITTLPSFPHYNAAFLPP